MTILGIDPGSVRVGYGLIARNKNSFVYHTSGLLPIPDGEQGAQLFTLERSLEKVIDAGPHPDVAVVEKLFFTKNKKTAIRVAQARGVIIKTLAAHGIPIEELSPSSIKLAVTGSGTADKKAVAKMVALTLGIDVHKRIDDETDALAIAIAGSSLHNAGNR